MLDLQTLNDERAIQHIYMLYCDLVDAKDFDRLGEVFTADTHGDYSQALGEGVVTEGLEAIIGAMHANLGTHSACGTTHHNVTNFRIAVEGDTARAKVHYIAAHAGAGPLEGKSYVMWGEYADLLVRTASGWRVKDRIYALSCREGDPAIVSGAQ
jgi:3-phenylpropionate/cinnamic acid dioxygenase small subunit